MRQISSLPNQSLAKIIHDYLFVKNIENTVEPEEGGTWSLWIHDDAHIDEARDILTRFLSNPNDPEFQRHSLKAEFLRARQRKEETRAKKQFVDIRTSWYRQQARTGKLTLSLIIISVIVAVISGLGSNIKLIQPLFITDYQVIGGYVQWRAGLPEITHGQVWRLFTPMFIHFGFIHILFNMLWLKDLGTMIEFRQGTYVLGALVLVVAALSNLGQYLVSGPTFGGMSGVVYGLLGYIWIRGKYDPQSGLYLHRTVVIWMIAWFVICLTGVIGNVANTAHGVGLAVGVVWGFISSRRFLLQRP